MAESAVRNGGLRARYWWHNSPNPALAALRCRLDDSRQRVPSICSILPGNRLVLGYLGLPEGLNHVLPFLEGRRSDSGDPYRVGSKLSWQQAADPALLPDCDLLAIGCTAARVASLPSRAALTLPFRIQLVVDVPTDPGEVRRHVSRKERQHAERQIRRYGWAVRQGTPGDFDYFFDHLHLPTMDRRHGSATRSMGKAMARECLMRRGILLLLCAQQEILAGLLCRIERDPSTATLRLAGVRDGSPKLYADGVLPAMYLMLLEWAAGNGIRRLDLSGCEPFLSKGLYQFKRKFHPRVAWPSNHFGGKRLQLVVRRDTPAVRDFLVDNPVFVADPAGAGFRAVYFWDADRPPRWDLQWRSPGVTGASQWQLDEFLSELPRAKSAGQPCG